MFTNRSSLLSLENEQIGDTVTAEQDVVPAIAEFDEVVTETEENLQEAAAIDATVQQGEEAIEEIDGIEELHDDVAASVEAGEGIPEEAAVVLEKAIARASKRLGITPSRRLSTESFKAGSKLSASRLSLEGIKETLVSAWEAVKKFFQGLWGKIKDFFAKVFTNLPKLRKQILAMQDRAQQTKGTTMKADKIKTGASAFQMDGKANKASVQGVIGVYTELLDGLVPAFDAFKGSVSKVAQSLDAKGSAGVDTKKLSKDFLAPLSGIHKASSSNKKPSEIGDMRFEGEVYGPFLNGQNLYLGVVYSKDTKKADRADAATPFFQMANGKDKAPAEIEAMKAAEVSTLGDWLVALVDSAEKVDREKGKIEQALNEGVKACDHAIKLAQTIVQDASGGSEARAALAEGRIWLTKASSAANRIVTMAPAMAGQCVRAGLSYGNACLSNLKEA